LRITDIKTIPLTCPLKEPIGDATAQWDAWNALLVQVFTDEGIVGLGEVSPLHGREMAVFEAIIQKRLRQLVVGEDPFDRERLWDKMLGKGSGSFTLGSEGAVVSAIAGVDIALWDIAGKALNSPICRLLGGCYRRKIRVYASGLFNRAADPPLTPKELAEEAKGYVKEGFTAIKMKIGFDMKRDLEKVAAVREAIGPDVNLMVDANQGYSFPVALKMARELEKYEVSWFEEPIPSHDLDSLAALAAAVDIPIALGENEYSRYRFRDILVKRAADIVQPDIVHAGGITECKRIISMASAWEVPYVPHIYSTIGLVGTLHLIASTSNAFIAEYIKGVGEWALRNELFTEPLKVEGGYIKVPDGPGLGIKIKEDAIDRYSYRG